MKLYFLLNPESIAGTAADTVNSETKMQQ